MRYLFPAFLLASVALSVACENTDTDEKDDLDTDTETVEDDTDTIPADTDVVSDTDLLCYDEGTTGTCWDCELPAAPEADSLKALNQCTTSSSLAFDNGARIPAATWTPGNPLPAVP